MFWKAVYLASIIAMSVVAYGEEHPSMKFVFVDVYDRKIVEEATAIKLKVSPVLFAVRESGGVLKGSEPQGKRVIIEVPTGSLGKLQSSKAVKSMSMEVPETWNPVIRLKLSYEAENSLAEEDLKDLGFKLIEDYRKGSFMIVEPVGEQTINAKLVSKLEENKKIEFVTAVFRAKAIQP